MLAVLAQEAARTAAGAVEPWSCLLCQVSTLHASVPASCMLASAAHLRVRSSATVRLPPMQTEARATRKRFPPARHACR